MSESLQGAIETVPNQVRQHLDEFRKLNRFSPAIIAKMINEDQPTGSVIVISEDRVRRFLKGNNVHADAFAIIRSFVEKQGYKLIIAAGRKNPVRLVTQDGVNSDSVFSAIASLFQISATPSNWLPIEGSYVLYTKSEHHQLDPVNHILVGHLEFEINQDGAAVVREHQEKQGTLARDWTGYFYYMGDDKLVAIMRSERDFTPKFYILHLLDHSPDRQQVLGMRGLVFKDGAPYGLYWEEKVYIRRDSEARSKCDILPATSENLDDEVRNSLGLSKRKRQLTKRKRRLTKHNRGN